VQQGTGGPARNGPRRTGEDHRSKTGAPRQGSRRRLTLTAAGRSPTNRASAVHTSTRARRSPTTAPGEYAGTSVTVSGCVTDADIQAEVDHAVSAAGWTPESSSEF